MATTDPRRAQRPQRAVLGDEVTRDDIDDVMRDEGLQLTNVIPGSDGVPPQLIFAADESDYLHLVEDARLGVVYVVAAGPSGDRLLARVRTKLPCLEDDALEALDDLLGRPDVDVAAVRPGLAACVLCHPAEPRTPGRLSRALGYADPEVRRAALVAATYAPSRALYAALAKIRDGDDVVELRGQAARLLDAILRGEAA
jgi:hypothetical protein